MIPNINIFSEPPDPALNNNRNAGARASRSQSFSTASATSNSIADSRFGRLSDLSGPSGEIAGEQDAAQLTQFARASILGRPAMAMAAQANQTPESVVQLLQ